MMYGSWDNERNGQIFLSFWTIFWFFIPLTTQKIKILEKYKKTWRYYHSTHVYHLNDNHMIYCSWDMEHDRQNFVILDHFLLFYPPNNLKNQNFEKMKKNRDDIIILQKCTKNHDHIMLHCSWDVAHDGCDYFSFWAIFCPVTPLTASKMKISKKWKQ